MFVAYLLPRRNFAVAVSRGVPYLATGLTRAAAEAAVLSQLRHTLATPFSDAEMAELLATFALHVVEA